MLRAGFSTLDLQKRQVRSTVVDTSPEFYQASLIVSIHTLDVLRPCKRYIVL